MAWILMIIGGLAALGGLINGLSTNTISAVQQTVQRLDLVIGLLGQAIVAISLLVIRVQDMIRLSMTPAGKSEPEEPATSPAQ